MDWARKMKPVKAIQMIAKCKQNAIVLASELLEKISAIDLTALAG